MNLILYILYSFLLMTGILLVKKSDKEQSLIKWIVISILMVMLWNAFLAGIYGLFNVPICIISVSIPSLIVAIFLIFKGKSSKQKYVFFKADKLFLIILVFVVLLFWGGYFLFKLPIRFTSVDASVHCRWAKQIAFDHTLSSNLFFGYVNDGLLMEAFLPTTGEVGFYHSFTLARIFDFVLAVLSFYALVSSFGKNKYQKGLSIFLSFVYLFGYPLYAIIFGFVYFGDSVTIITVLLILLSFYNDSEINHLTIITLLNMCLYGIFTSYTLFVPNVFLSVFIYIVCIIWKRNNQSFFKCCFTELIKIFTLPCVLGMIYAYVNLKEISSSGGGISNEGGKYFDLYSNFVFLIPFVISGVISNWKKKKIDCISILFVITTIYTLILFAGVWNGKVSTYYLSKLYNIIWLLSFIFLIKGLHEISLMNKTIINAAICVFLTLCCSIMVEADTKFSEYGLVRRDSASALDIYFFNKSYFFGQWVLQDGDIKAFEKTKELAVQNDEALYIGEEVKANWYMTFTNQKDIELNDNINEITDRLKNGKYSYLVIDSIRWDSYQEDFLKIGKIVNAEQLENEVNCEIVILKLS